MLVKFAPKNILSDLKENKKNLSIKYEKRRPGDIAQVYSNTKKFQKILKWRPKYDDIKLIIQSAIKWEKNRRTNY